MGLKLFSSFFLGLFKKICWVVTIPKKVLIDETTWRKSACNVWENSNQEQYNPDSNLCWDSGFFSKKASFLSFVVDFACYEYKDNTARRTGLNIKGAWIPAHNIKELLRQARRGLYPPF
jgi:hypothetical protein